MSLRDTWDARWNEACSIWSRLVRLSPPRWCHSAGDEKREGLTGSFAMIRHTDHAVVLSSRQIAERRLGEFALEIMAHEIGHHVYCPGDLADHGRMLARTRRGLPTKEHLAPFVANLYADLLVNDRLQRSARLDMASVYRALGTRGESDRLWTLYMRIYEHLWSLERGSLAAPCDDERLELDARLGARLVRAYAKDWLRGAGRFAALCFPYLAEDEAARTQARLRAWLDTIGAGRGGSPDGLTSIDDDEDDAVHPAFDPDLSGIDDTQAGEGAGRARRGGAKSRGDARDIGEYGALLRALGYDGDDRDLAIRYYRERALPHLVRFPSRRSRRGTEPLPEGVDTWEPGSPLERIDWIESVVRSPFVVPGVTTVERTYGDTPGPEARREPLDLYVGIDCSGSMPNPRMQTSYPALAGAIVCLSALRAGARAKIVLSGEPGKTFSMKDFSRDEREVMDVLTQYLGTGYGFGVKRLADTFASRSPADRAVHVLLLTDFDVFSLLDDAKDGTLGWDVAKRSLDAARGGGTIVLNAAEANAHPGVVRLREDGWDVRFVPSWEAVVDFARAFARKAYEEEKRT